MYSHKTQPEEIFLPGEVASLRSESQVLNHHLTLLKMHTILD